MYNKMKGYRVERKVKLMFVADGWKVVRAGGSLGEYDLIAFKNGECVFLQIKSTKKDKFYYYGYMEDKYEGFPFRLVVDFGRGNVRITKPGKMLTASEGEGLEDFLHGNSFH